MVSRVTFVDDESSRPYLQYFSWNRQKNKIYFYVETTKLKLNVGYKDITCYHVIECD
jgi:hypothetical protein